jgi:hypothetical protein
MPTAQPLLGLFYTHKINCEMYVKHTLQADQ